MYITVANIDHETVSFIYIYIFPNSFLFPRLVEAIYRLFNVKVHLFATRLFDVSDTLKNSRRRGV